MDRTQPRTRYLEWDVRNWSVALDFWRARSRIPLAGARVLEIGAHGGGLTLWLADQGAHVVCTDRYQPRPEAIALHRANGVDDRVEYRSVDATAIPFEGEFDLVVFKSVLGALGEKEAQVRAVAGMHRALRPGGELLFAENLVGSPVHMYLRRRLTRWGSAWRYITLAEMREFLAPFAETRLLTIGTVAALGRTEPQRDALARADRAVLDRVVPDRWKYIVAGVARKAASPATDGIAASASPVEARPPGAG